MKNLRRRSNFFVSCLVVPIFAVVLSASLCAAQGVIISLENTGPSPITDAGLGFTLSPQGKSEVDVRNFQIGVIPLSIDNPLPPGGTACVGPISHLNIRDYFEFAGVNSFGNGCAENFSDRVQLKPNVTILPFDCAVAGAQGGRIAGIFRFFSSVPDSCRTGYVPPFGTMIINQGAALTTSTSAALYLHCYATVGYTCREMRFSNDNKSWSAPEPFINDKTWTLSPGDGEKTVYVRFKDDLGNWSNASSDTITLSTPTLAQIRSFPIPAFPDPGGYAVGLAFGGGKLFTINHFNDCRSQYFCPPDSDKAKIYVLDPTNGNILNSFSAPPGARDITSDGVNLYVSTRTSVDILKLDSTTGSILTTIHPSDASIGGVGSSYIWGITYLNDSIYQAATTQNCGGISIVGMNSQDGSFDGCFTATPEHYLSGTQELDSTGISLLYGRWVRDVKHLGTSFWTVSTFSQSGSLLKSDIIPTSETHSVSFETWGDNQLFVADKKNNQILVFQLPSAVRVVPARLNFGQTIIGGTSTPQPVTISNTGSANLSIKAIETSGANASMFSVEMGGPNPCSSLTPTIAPGEDCTVNVTFSPGSTLEKTALLSISSNTTDENPVVNVALSGVGAVTPNGGEIIPSGSTYAIQWGSNFDAVRFDLKYSTNNGSTWKTIASKVTGTGYDWHVPIPSNNIASCLVKVIGFDSSGNKVGQYVSSFPFTIEVVKVTSPKSGENLKSGDIRTITWRTNGTTKPVASVKLSYSIDGGVSWNTIETLKSNTGTYDWTVPTVSNFSTGCKVKLILRSADGTVVGSDASDGVFTIQP